MWYYVLRVTADISKMPEWLFDLPGGSPNVSGDAATIPIRDHTDFMLLKKVMGD
jgi:hypothetical protein